MIQSAPDGAVHLGHAAKAIRVLHARIIGQMGLANLAVGSISEGFGADLPWVRAGEVNARIEGYRSTRKASRDIAPARSKRRFRVGRKATADCRHGLGPLSKARPSLARGAWGSGRLPRGLGRRTADSLKKGFPFADQDQGKMGQGGQISTGSHRSSGGNDGMDPGVEQVYEQLDELGTDATEAFREDVGAQQQHGADLFGERSPRPQA